MTLLHAIYYVSSYSYSSHTSVKRRYDRRTKVAARTNSDPGLLATRHKQHHTGRDDDDHGRDSLDGIGRERLAAGMQWNPDKDSSQRDDPTRPDKRDERTGIASDCIRPQSGRTEGDLPVPRATTMPSGSKS